MAGTGLIRGQGHHDPPLGHLEARVLHDPLERTTGDDRHLEQKKVGQVEWKGMGLVAHGPSDCGRDGGFAL